MPEFEGVSETLSLQEALEAAVRKAYTAHQRRTHTEPLFRYAVKRISGHLRTVTVVIETFAEETPSAPKPPTEEAAAPTATADPIKALIDKQRRGEPLTPNEQALIELLQQDPKKDR
jgi:hypothetical protein